MAQRGVFSLKKECFSTPTWFCISNIDCLIRCPEYYITDIINCCDYFSQEIFPSSKSFHFLVAPLILIAGGVNCLFIQPRSVAKVP